MTTPNQIPHGGSSGNRVTTRQRIVYVAPDCTDSAVIKRAHGFVGLGHELVSFSFRRARYNVDYEPDWPNVELGNTTELRLAARILSYAQALRMFYRHRRRWQAASVLYARNLDLAILALMGKALTRSRARFVYEILDVHPILASSSLGGRMLRWLERCVLNRCDLLVVSSPAFLDRYFGPVQHYRAASFVLENKWPSESMPVESHKLSYELAGHDMVWTIGWFGNLRCQQSLDILTELADALPARVRIYMRGCASLLGERTLMDRIRDRPNMIYEGEYTAPKDFPSIFSQVHFNWCADFCNGDNSQWLVPNRLYEGGYFGVPAISIAAHETGRLVQQRQLGLALEAPVIDRLKDLFRGMTRDDYVALRLRVEQRPASDFVGTDQLRQLMNAIGQTGNVASENMSVSVLADGDYRLNSYE